MDRRTLILLSALLASPSGSAAPAPALLALPGGGWRIPLAPEAETIPPALLQPLAELGGRLAEELPGRVTLLSHATGPGLDPSFTRRLALRRALAVEAALVAGGLPRERIDLRPLGRATGLDAVDILPPGARVA
ncbi:MAG: hypothetical protein NZN45_12190 [Rhodovarius sp.]|nr:hypothetical protein [Rhodovarius sp.]